MSPDTLIALVLLAATAAFTPGPNNALLASSGATFGLRRSLPHVIGVGLGFSMMIFIVGLFLGELFQSSRLLREGLRVLGAGLLLWLAWKIASSGGISRKEQAPRPFTFVEAAAFQWINPKAWAMAIAITAQFIRPEAAVRTAAIVGAVFIIAGLSSAASWAAAGQALTRWVDTPQRLKRFNQAMAVLIVISVLLLFLG